MLYSVFYFPDVTVSNYGGLMRTAAPSTTPSSSSSSSANAAAADVAGSADPRYALRGGRRVPDYYLTEVVEGRRTILRALLKWGADPKTLPSNDGAALGYCTATTTTSDDHFSTATSMTTHQHHGKDDGESSSSSSSSLGSYSGGLPATLGSMPVGPHQHVLDPCAGPNTHGRAFELTVMEKDGPAHRPYSALLHRSSYHPIVSSSPLTPPPPSQCSSLEEEEGEGQQEDQHYHHRQQLRIAVIHHHVPLYSRYGCDKRLFSVLESLKIGLGHAVGFGGKHVSDFETQQDKRRLQDVLSIPVVTPLADGETVKFSEVKKLLALTASLPLPLPPPPPTTLLQKTAARKAQGHGGGSGSAGGSGVVDVVVLTLWFWSTAPIPRDFLPIVRLLSPSTKVKKGQ